MDAIVKTYVKEMSSKKTDGKRVKNGYLDSLINEKKHEFSVDDQVAINQFKTKKMVSPHVSP